jgi:hypothetical protein
MPRASSRSSSSADRELVAAPVEELAAARVGRELRLCEPKRERERDEALLRAVVQVPLEPAASVVARGDDARPRRTQLFFLALALGDVEPAGDDADDLPGVVEHGRAAPGDHALLAPRVREDVLVLSRRVIGAAARKRAITASRSLLSMIDVPEERPRTCASLS